MTGLYPDIDRIIEIAVVVTGPHLETRWKAPCWLFIKMRRSWTRWTLGIKEHMAAAV